MKKQTEQEKKDMINQIYQELKERMIHPSGKFDNGGRWYAENADLISCRTPSRAWPYSEMQACRTKKYVTKVAEKYNCKTTEELRASV
jgi:hypothetical protein